MVRILSALVLIPVFVAAIWFFTPLQLLVLAEVILVAAFVEDARLVEHAGTPIPRVASMVGAVVVCAAVAWPGVPVDAPLMATLVALGALAVGAGEVGPGVLARISAAGFGVLWLALPIGAFVALDDRFGRESVLLLVLTISVSDTAQFYTGRLFGRHLLSPVVSPKKTVEGAVGGFVFGTASMMMVGRWWLPPMSTGWLAGFGVVVVAFGMLGDLFESLVKRSAGVKDSSALIPGHGGILDRIDALLFATPAFYILLRYGLH